MKSTSNLYAVVGLPGSGKTTLIKALARSRQFCTANEDPTSRPFQLEAVNDPHRFTYLNQLDFLVYKATQQMQVQNEIDNQSKRGILDGCVDFDLWFFSGVFRRSGWLRDDEFEALTVAYNAFRQRTPIPRLVILTADIAILESRIASRGRAYELVGMNSLANAVAQVDEFLDRFSDNIFLTLDTSNSTIEFETEVSLITRESEIRL